MADLASKIGSKTSTSVEIQGKEVEGAVKNTFYVPRCTKASKRVGICEITSLDDFLKRELKFSKNPHND